MLFIFNVCKNKILIFKTQYFVEVIVIWCLRNVIYYKVHGSYNKEILHING